MASLAAWLKVMRLVMNSAGRNPQGSESDAGLGPDKYNQRFPLFASGKRHFEEPSVAAGKPDNRYVSGCCKVLR